MDHTKPEIRPSNEARDDDDQVIFCSTCAMQPRLLIAILDSRKGKTVRVFECQCEEVIWDD
jgi:hypothetical protein